MVLAILRFAARTGDGFTANARYRRCYSQLMAPMDPALKILAVDDNPSIRYSMRFIFAGPRYEVTGVQDAGDALARFDASSNGYDVIIVDQKMLHLTGVELVQEIRRQSFAGKIIVLSAHLSPEICEAYQQMDVHVILDKPFNIQELRSTVDRLLVRARQSVS